jgi:hypothetical protein
MTSKVGRYVNEDSELWVEPMHALLDLIGHLDYSPI